MLRLCPMYKVVIFSSGMPSAIAKLVRRIHSEVPGTEVCGVLLERRPGKTLGKRVSAFIKNVKDPQFLSYAASRIAESSSQKAIRSGMAVVGFIHAATPEYPPDQELTELCPCLITTDCHSPEALDFVRSLGADLGIVYGTRILKPCLFKIPAQGSINIHKRKVPDYRGGGPVGLWEMLDGQPEIGVTVHEVEEQLDSGAVVNQASIPIQPYDTLNSLALKAHVVANDLLVRSVADYAHDTVKRTPQIGQSRMFKNPSPQKLAQLEKQLAGQRPHYRPPRGRSALKLFLRSIAGAPLAAARNWTYRLNGNFPITILFHHLVSDRSHGLGMSTDHFLKHVEFLREFYQIVSLAEAIRMLRANTVQRPTAVLTIDDGYGDNFLTLRAIRERLDVPLTLFVSTGILNGECRFPHDVRSGNTDFHPLTWDQLRQMDREGFEIGSHTRTHFDCGSTNLVSLRQEIVGSKEELQHQLGHAVQFFSFPFGLPKNISAEAMQLACAHYPYVFSAYGGRNFASRNGDFKHLRRAAHANDLWELELTLQNLLELEPANPIHEAQWVSRTAASSSS